MTRPWAGEESLSSAHELGISARYRLWTVRKGRAVVEMSAQTGCADELSGRFALACGTPAVGPARQWAQLLADHACRTGLPAPGALQSWLAPAHRAWRAQLTPAKEPLWASVSHGLPVLGAAALGLVELSPADHPERFHVEAILQGEVCLFIVRGTHTRLRMPALQAADLTGNGASLFSEPIPPRLPPTTVSTDARFGDVLVLASPSLGAWLYHRLEEGRDPWQLLFNLPDDQYFANIIRNERDNERLPDDDVALMLIRTDPLPNFDDLDEPEITSRLIDHRTVDDLLTPEIPAVPEPLPAPNPAPAPELELELDQGPEAELEPEPAFMEEAVTEQDLSPFDLPEPAAAPSPPTPLLALDAPAPAALSALGPPPEEPLEALASEEEDWDDWDDGEEVIEALESEEVPRPAGMAVISLGSTMKLTFSEDEEEDDDLELEDWSALQESLRPGAIVELERPEAALDSGVWEEDLGIDLDEEEDELDLDEEIPTLATIALVPPPTRVPTPRVEVEEEEDDEDDLDLDIDEWSAEEPQFFQPVPARDERPAEDDGPANQRWLMLAAVLVLVASAVILPDRVRSRADAEAAAPKLAVPLAASVRVTPPPPTLLRTDLEQAEAALASLSGDWQEQRPRLAAQASTASAAVQAEQAAAQAAKDAEEAAAIAAREAAARKARQAEEAAARAAQKAKAREAAQAVAAAAPPKPTPRPAAKPDPAPAAKPRSAPSGIQPSAGAPPTGWIRCSSPCSASGSSVKLPSLAPIWESPFSADRVGLAASGSYTTVGSQQVGNDLWVEVRLSR